ncbi:VOC family protein [Phyllobacterium sp. SB3]|uniref:bleomycin resistance protein n=1 Tax=Phyllobacterium sp. SB3 TaxID=3156073 RepID=UPI0032AE85DF
MSTPASANLNAPIILSAEPQIFVSDVELACAFYVGKLGFEVAFTYGQPPFYAQLFRGGGRLNVRKASGPVFDSSFRARERDALSATLTLSDAKALFLEYQTAGIVFHQPLRTEPWGSRTFIVQDPDGNLICFAGK